MISPRWTLYLVGALFAFIIGVVLIFAPPADVCKDHHNLDNVPLPTEAYFDIPPECRNQTRMYPDESFTDGGITYKYTEYPEDGWASVVAMIPDNDVVRSFQLSGMDRMFRGRYVINDTHNFFIEYKTPPEYDWNWSYSPNVTSFNWSWDWLQNDSQWDYNWSGYPIPEGCYENYTGQDPNDLVIHMTCPEGVSP